MKNVVLILVLALTTVTHGQVLQDKSFNTYQPNCNGWKFNPELADRLARSVPPKFVAQLNDLAIVADEDKEMFLWRYVMQASKEFGQEGVDYVTHTGLPLLIARNQGSTGSCVGNGSATAGEYLVAVQIYGLGKQESYVRWNADLIYAIGRTYGEFHRSDGSTGAWSVAGMASLGTLHRLEYPFGNFTQESDRTARRLGSRPLSREFIEEAGKHKLLNYVRVDNVQQAMGAIQSGYPIIICSRVGFENGRNNTTWRGNGRYSVVQSASEASASPRGSWAHCMMIAGYSDGYFLIVNSWGSENRETNSGWVAGPVYPKDQPLGSFWCDSRTMARILGDRDSWALSSYEGFEDNSRRLNWPVILDAGGKVVRNERSKSLTSRRSDDRLSLAP